LEIIITAYNFVLLPAGGSTSDTDTPDTDNIASIAFAQTGILKNIFIFAYYKKKSIKFAA
jgi:hypothetical protein